jgi:hypothetical protein
MVQSNSMERVHFDLVWQSSWWVHLELHLSL